MRTIKQLYVTGDRTQIRRQVINAFLDEEAGTGTGENAAKYIYEVEELEDGKVVFLKRPAMLNKGFDFEVNVSDTNFGLLRRTSMPSHSVILVDLKEKKDKAPVESEKARLLIERIYRCENISNAEYRELQFTQGHSIELILKVIKWLFIEQDVTYWNFSGREKFYTALMEIWR